MTRVEIRQDELSWRQVGDDIVVLDERTSKYLRLQGSASLLWPSLVAGTTPEHLASVLVERFGIDTPHARRDVDTFLDDLTSRELVTTA